MKKNILYAILIASLILNLSFFMGLQNKNNLLLEIKEQTVKALDNKISCSYVYDKYDNLEEKLISLKRQLDLTTANKEDILIGKIAYSKNSLLTGSMPNNGKQSNWNPNSSSSKTYQAGYYPNDWTVSTENAYNSGYNKGNNEAPKVDQIIYSKIQVYTSRDKKGSGLTQIVIPEGFTKMTISSIDEGNRLYGSSSISISGSLSGGHGAGTSTVIPGETIIFSLSSTSKPSGSHECSVLDIILTR